MKIRIHSFAHAAIVVAVIMLVCTFALAAQASDSVAKSYTVAPGEYVEMRVEDLSGIADVSDPYISFYYADFSEPSDGTNTAVLENFYDGSWHNRTFVNGWARGLILIPDGLVRFKAMVTGVYTFNVFVTDDEYIEYPFRLIEVTVANPNTTPSFVGSSTSLTVAESSSNNSAVSLLQVSDTDAGQTLTWTQATAPSHGSLTISGATASSGGTDIAPGGTIVYTPAMGYSGSDSFTVQVSDGTATALRTINVTVLPKPAITSISPSGGLTTGGTAVTITGSGFTNVSAVKFGSTNATAYTVNSATQITATAPAAVAGTVHITVTSDTGSSTASAADQFTYAAPVSPTISGDDTLTLKLGYAATSTNAYTITGTEPVTVTKTSGNAAITWNDTTKKLDIAAGLPEGSYFVALQASNGYNPIYGITFMLYVTVAPEITGDTSMTLTEGYSATATSVYTITGTAPVTVTKTSGNDAITWNSSTKKINIAAGLTEGSYPVELKASNGTSPDATLTFTLTVNAAPKITGDTSLSLTEGYTATSTGAYTITGTAPVTVTKTSGNDAITWNDTTKKLDIAAGLAEGSYPVELKASNGILPDDTLTFTLSVSIAPEITGDTAMSLTEGYSAKATSVYTITGTAPVTVTKTSGNAAITWNDTTKKLEIAAGLTEGSYPVVLKASNGTLPDGTLTFTLTVTILPDITGDTSMSLTEGYSETSTSAYTITGTAPVTVTKTSGNAAITWNDTTKKLDIAAGLAEGSYPVVLKASNGILPDDTLTFTLTVSNAPVITGDTALTLKEGYSATATGSYTITGTTPITVTKTSGNAAITWNDTTRKLDIAAGLTEGSYPVVLKASNGTLPDGILTFTLTVTSAPEITGDASVSLTEGYTATSTNVYTISGTAPVTVTKTSGNAAITWNDTTKKLDIAAGLAVGSYPVELQASNGTLPNDSFTFTLTVNPARTLQVVEVPSDIPSTSLVSISENGTAFDQSVEIRIQASASAGQQIADALRTSTGRTDITDLNIFPLDISAFLAGTDTRVQPNAGTSVTFTIPVPAEYLNQLENLVIVSMSGGSPEILHTEIITVSGVACVRFTATHFSPYAFVTASSAVQVITGEASNVALTTATLNAGITTGGTAVVTERGFTYSTSAAFTGERSVKAGSGAGSYSANVSALDPFTTYYVRAYAVSAGNTTYGNTVQFSTYDMAGAPKTGDSSNPWLWLALGGIAAIGIVTLLMVGKRKKCAAGKP